jgi:transposase
VVMIGTDSHKRTHTVVALDDVGRGLGELTVAANTDGHLKLLAWARRWEQVSFALEDCRHLTRRLERDLLGAGARVVRVPTRLMAGARRGGREPGRSDPIDAEAVALAALRHDGLPTAELDGPAPRDDVVEGKPLGVEPLCRVLQVAPSTTTPPRPARPRRERAAMRS